MLSVIDQPELRQRISLLTVAEYHQLGEFNGRGKKTELIRGIIVEKMSKSPLHGSIASILQRILTPMVPDGFCIRREEPLTCCDSEPEPDLTIVPGRNEDFLQAHPTTALLTVEVAVTTVRSDRAMAEIYAEAGVGEYWVVLPKERAIEVYREPDGLNYRQMQRYDFEERLKCTTVPNVEINLSELFAGLSPAENSTP